MESAVWRPERPNAERGRPRGVLIVADRHTRKLLRWCTTEARKCTPPGAVRLRRSPTVWVYFEWAQRRDPQRANMPLVATAHYLVRVTWVMLRRGIVWEEKLAPAKESSAA
jgi:hypothetical protein